MNSLGTIILETNVNPVLGGGTTPGWISGSPASLADGASVDCIFDLGPRWNEIDQIQVSIFSSVATSLSSIQFYSGDSTVVNTNRRLKDRNSIGPSTVFATVTTAQGPQQFGVMPMGRYFVARMTNTAAGGAQGATSKVTLALYPRI